MTKIAIITDGGQRVGLGHVYQSITLAKEISKKLEPGSRLFFLTKSDRVVTDLISGAGFEVSRYRDNRQILDALKREAPDRVIFDKVDVAENLAKEIKKRIACRLAIFTNLTRANSHADITVIADLDGNFKNVRRQEKRSGKIHFSGPKYWILRPEFYAYGAKKKKTLKAVKNIMLIFGGADPNNLTTIVLKELLRMKSPFAITAVLGANFRRKKELLDIIRKETRWSRSRVKVVCNLKDVAGTMFKSDVVFASPGLSFFEALVVKTPVLGFHQNELQRTVYRKYLTTIDKKEVSKISSIIEKKSFIFPDDPFIKSMEIGQGKKEIINSILN